MAVILTTLIFSKMNYNDTLDYLYNSVPMFQQVGSKAYKEGLENTLALDEHFNHPHRSFRSIHIAGTNGKGSCSHTLAAILQEAGYRVLGVARRQETIDHALAHHMIDAGTLDPEEFLAFERSHTYLGAGFLKRCGMLVAGPLVNVLLAFLIVTFAFMVRGVDYIPNVSTLGGVEEGSIAYEVGLRAGDQIASIDGVEVSSWDSLVEELTPLLESGTDFDLEYVRDGTEQTAGYVFAGDVRVPMTNIYTLVSNERRDRFNTKDLGGGQYMPDGIQQYANHMFEGKGLTQEAIVNVDRGRLRLGVTVDDGTGKSWIIFDNFRLTYLGKDDTQTEEPEKIAGISDVRYREGDRAHLCITFDGSEDLAFEHGTAGLVTITDTEGRKVAYGTSVTNCFDDEWHHTSVRLTLSKALPEGEYTLNIPKNSLLLKELGYDVYRLPLSITFNNNETEEGDGDNSEPETETEKQQTYADGIRIAWQYNRQRYIGGGSYGRAIRLDNGKYVMVYSTGGSNIGGNNYIRWQEQPYGDWSEATVTRAQDEYHTNKNAEIIELKDGRLMYAWLHRTNYENSQGPSKIMAAYSSDGGKTWQNEQVIYTATDTYGLGVWEPAMIQLPTGELQIYFANEASAGGGTQNISMRRSYNGGRSWQPGTEIVSYRSGSRDGMPVPVYLKDRKGIAVAIEDPGFMGTFKPMVVHTDAADNWTSGTVDGNSAHRWSIFASSKDYLPSEVYCGQPYLIQLSTGETVYSAASGEDRNPDTSDTHGRMAVYVGDSDARNFIARSFPFPFVENTGARAIWNSIMQYNDSTLMAVCTVEGNVERSGIWTNEGKIIRPIASMQTGTERKWDSLPHELFIGAESQAEARIRSLWDNDSLYFRIEVKDRLLNLSDNMHETDGVEVFISTVKPTSARKYSQYRLRVDARGRVEKQYGSGARWIADDAVNTCGHVETGADGYTIVVAVPWQEIGGKPAGEELYCCYQLHNTDKTGGKTATVDETLSGSDIDDATTWMRMPLETSPDTGTGIESVTVREKENGDLRTYNIMGQEVDEHAKGIIISKGKKMLRK